MYICIYIYVYNYCSFPSVSGSLFCLCVEICTYLEVQVCVQLEVIKLECMCVCLDHALMYSRIAVIYEVVRLLTMNCLLIALCLPVPLSWAKPMPG